MLRVEILLRGLVLSAVGQECPTHNRGYGLVIAPSDADVTSAAYFANTPVL